MTQIDQIKSLLGKVDVITWKYRHILQEPQYRFNIFAILRQEDDEVYLHSRFLAELLDPRGDHCQDHALLEAFLQQVGIEGFRMNKVSVRREYQDIDILVTNADQAVIIENKIYAQDQKRQLQRYYEVIRDEGFKDIFVIYLTLSGYAPSSYSLGTLPEEIGDDAIYTISYRDDVHTWLEKCIRSTYRHPVLRETLVQYQRLVERLTGQSFSKGYTMEIKELLKDETNIELAVNISKALVEAQIDIQLAFWEELERRLLEAGLELAKDQPYCDRYSRKKVRKYYETQTAGWGYGLTVKLAVYDEKTDLAFYVKVRRRIYCGFRAYRGTTSKTAQEPQFDHLADLVKQVDPSFQRSDYSIGWKGLPGFSFKSFNKPTVYKLADPERREQIVGELAGEITTHINRFMELYEENREQQKASA